MSISRLNEYNFKLNLIMFSLQSDKVYGGFKKSHKNETKMS